MNISTPTIATGTSITGTPSATNSTHRSPPHTPHSSNRPPKTTAVSAPPPPETQSDVNSSVDKNSRRPEKNHPPSAHRSVATTTNAKHSNTSSKLNGTNNSSDNKDTSMANHATIKNNTGRNHSNSHSNRNNHSNTNINNHNNNNNPGNAVTSPNSVATATAQASASACGQTQVQGPTTRVTKPRDKQAKLRKRLKCCTHEQLMEHLISLVRTNAVGEKVVYESTPPADIPALVGRCRDLRDGIYALLPGEAGTATSPYDAEAHRRCKKALAAFKSSVTSMGKTLVEASLWQSVIQYCVGAAEVNDQTPVWAEASHNKWRTSVVTKLEHFALRAVTAMGKSKTAVFNTRDELLGLAETCRKAFPAIAAKLEALKSGGAEGPVERVDFDDPMISNTQLDLAM